MRAVRMVNNKKNMKGRDKQVVVLNYTLMANL